MTRREIVTCDGCDRTIDPHEALYRSGYWGTLTAHDKYAQEKELHFCTQTCIKTWIDKECAK